MLKCCHLHQSRDFRVSIRKQFVCCKRKLPVLPLRFIHKNDQAPLLMSSWNREVSAFGCFHQIGRLLIIRLLIPRPGAHRSVYAVQNYGFDLFCSLDKVSLTIQAFLWITIQALLLGTTQATQGPISELLPMKPNVFFYLQKHCWLCVRSHLYSCLPPPSFFSFYWGANRYLIPDIFFDTQPGSVLKIIGYLVPLLLLLISSAKPTNPDVKVHWCTEWDWRREVYT